MAIKYWRVRLSGVRSVEEIHSTIGRSGAIVVRVHFEPEATQVYVAADESGRERVAETIAGAEALEEVSAAVVTKLD
jgi:hypothetical protein